MLFRSIMKIINSCQSAGLPTPELREKEGGFIVTLFKDRFSKEELQQLGLNDRQIDALLFYKDKKEITSSEYAERYKISDRTARTDLTELVDKELLKKQGDYKTTKFCFR